MKLKTANELTINWSNTKRQEYPAAQETEVNICVLACIVNCTLMSTRSYNLYMLHHCDVHDFQFCGLQEKTVFNSQILLTALCLPSEEDHLRLKHAVYSQEKKFVLT
jgi:hypothetical protein